MVRGRLLGLARGGPAAPLPRGQALAQFVPLGVALAPRVAHRPVQGDLVVNLFRAAGGLLLRVRRSLSGKLSAECPSGVGSAAPRGARSASPLGAGPAARRHGAAAIAASTPGEAGVSATGD